MEVDIHNFEKMLEGVVELSELDKVNSIAVLTHPIKRSQI